MDEFHSFVPSSLLDRLLRGGEHSAADARFRGTALFADITAYTRLAEDFCRQGTEGVEQLGQFLDSAFRRYVACVEDAGGEVACFAGDALLAYWTDADPGPNLSISRAKACADSLHNASLVDLAEGMESGRLHIGIGAGELWSARLGGVNGNWHLLLAGDAVREASLAANKAETGSTEFGRAAMSLQTQTAPGEAVVEANGPKRSAPADTGQGRKVEIFVPRVVQEWVGDGLKDWLPRVRSVCALLIRVDGLDYNQDNALELYQAAVETAMTAVQPFTGSAGTLVMDDKGLILKLCLGLPHDSHVDDALRAVAAGLAIERELKRLGLRCSAGVASGRGVCMPVGGPERQDYVAIGRFMHIAARLMETAQHGLLCTDEIADRVRGEFTLSPESHAGLKGIRESLRLFRAREVEKTSQRIEQLFGREFEQKKMLSQLDALEQGRGRLLWVVGEAGIGKSALIRDFIGHAEEREFSCLKGGATSVDNSVPYLAWRPIFGAILESTTSDVDDQGSEKSILDELRHPKLAPLINNVLPGLLEETDATRNLSGEARTDAIARTLSEVIGLHRPKVSVIVLEDCHWMDSASWRLLHRVAQDHPEILIVLTSRPGKLAREIEPLAQMDRFVEIRLGPLRVDAVGLIVEDLLDDEKASSELIADIVQRSSCNPLFIREYTLLLQSTRRDRRSDNRQHIDRRRETQRIRALPETVEGLIASRLDALRPDDEFVLKAASILGDEFRTELLAEVCAKEHGGGDLATALAHLVADDLLVETGAWKSSFSFRHNLIRQGAYEQLTATQRRSLHRSAAEVMEHLYAADLHRRVATLAHHWYRADVPDRAIEYADKAASQALSGGAYLEADRLLEICIDLASALEKAGHELNNDVIRWLRQTAEARRGTGQLESRSAAARQALARAGRLRSNSLFGLSVQASFAGAKLAARHLLPLFQKPGHSPLRLEIAEAYRHSAEVCYYNNDMVGMICDSISSVECADKEPPSTVLASASTELGVVLSIAGFTRIGERILKRAIQVAATAGDHSALAYAHLVSSLYAVGLGNWQESDRSSRFCQELCEPMGDVVNWTNAQAIRFWLAYYQNHTESAWKAAKQLRERARETGNRQHQAWSLRYLAQCELRMDQPERAAELLTAALESLGETAALNERIPAIALLALSMLRNGEVWGARAKAGDGLALISQIRRPIGHGVLEGYSALTEVVFDAWRTDPAASNWQRDAKRCLRVLRKYRAAFPIGEPRYRFWRGQYFELINRPRSARASYQRGAAAAARLQMDSESARCAQRIEALSQA